MWEKHHSVPCFGGDNSVAPLLRSGIQNVNMASQAGEKEVIVVPEEDPDDWPDVGPQNPEEADSYIEKINNIFETMVENVSHNKKDTLPSAMRNLKKLMSRHWPSVGYADPDIII